MKVYCIDFKISETKVSENKFPAIMTLNYLERKFQILMLQNQEGGLFF